MKILPRSIILLLTLTVQSSIAQHSHLNAGAESHSQDAKLVFDNGANFEVASGFVLPLNLAAEGTYAGYYEGGLTFAALPTTGDNGGPDPASSAPGSVIAIEMLSVIGPIDGEFGFWETAAATPTHTIVSGGSANHQWLLSQNDGSPGSDPFGHIHGRRWTATRPGIYDVSYRLIDVSENGDQGAPIHLPSEELTIRFIAGDGVPVTHYREGDYLVNFSIENDALNASLLINDGHSAHSHDPLNPQKSVIIVDAHQRHHVDDHEQHLGSIGSPLWKLPAGQPEEDEPHHTSATSAAAHEHDEHQTWDGADTPSIALRVLKDHVKGWNVFIDTTGFTYAPENASTSHVPGEGHAHIYVDGVKLGRVYNSAYYLGALDVGPHTIKVTLNSNNHLDYLFNGEPLEASFEIQQPEETSHSHSLTHEWAGAEDPHLSLDVRRDPAAGWNLFFEASHFTFAPENASGTHVPGEGHAHIYINDVKLTRLYGRAYHLPNLPEGEVTIRVGVSANDHFEYTLNGESLHTSIIIDNSPHAETPSVSLSTEDIGENILLDDAVAVSLKHVNGPGTLTLLHAASAHTAEDHHTASILTSSIDGIDSVDSFHLDSANQKPITWAFSAPGFYSVTLEASAELITSGNLTTEITIHFQVEPSEALEHAVIDGVLYMTWDTGASLDHAETLHSDFQIMQETRGAHSITPTGTSGFYRITPGQHHPE